MSIPKNAARSGTNIPDAQRKRPARRVTLSPEAWAWLDDRAEPPGGVSGVIDWLVLREKEAER